MERYSNKLTIRRDSTGLPFPIIRNPFRQYRSDTYFDVHDGVHLAEGREIQGDVVSEHDRIDVLLEDGAALDLEDIESDVAAAQKSLGRHDDLGDFLVVIVDDKDGVELVLVVVVVPPDDLVVVKLGGGTPEKAMIG